MATCGEQDFVQWYLDSMLMFRLCRNQMAGPAGTYVLSIICATTETLSTSWRGLRTAGRSSRVQIGNYTCGTCRCAEKPCHCRRSQADWQTGLQKPTNIGASPHTDTISAIQWRKDGSEFIVSSMDCKLVFYVSHDWTMARPQLTTVRYRYCDPTMVLQLDANRRFRPDARQHAYRGGHHIPQASFYREQAQAQRVCQAWRRRRAAAGSVTHRYEDGSTWGRYGPFRVRDDGAQSDGDTPGRQRDCRVSSQPFIGHDD